MSNLKFSTKFSLVSVIFLIPLLLSLTLLQREYSRDITFSQTEKVGLELIAKAQQEQLRLATSLIEDKTHTASLTFDLGALDNAQGEAIGTSLRQFLAELDSSPEAALTYSSALLQTIADRTNLELDQSLDSR